MRALVPVVLLAISSLYPLGAQPALEERLDVDLVLVDVTVTDSRGNQILGLEKDDFIVTEDGEPQEILSLDYFTNRVLVDQREEDAAFKVERVRQERYFVLFFHEPGDPSAIRGWSSELRRATRAAETWIEEEIQPQDRVAIAGFDTRLKVYADFTNDPTVLRRALHDVIGFSRGLREVPRYAADDASIMRNIDVRRMINDTGRVYDGLELLADALRPIPARKIMPLFSFGIGEPVRGTPILQNDETFYQPMMQALNSANVTVESIFMLRDVAFYPPEQTLSRLASETGGSYYKTFVSFETPLGRIENASSGYYLLTYRIRKPEGDEGYQKIDVRLRNPEFRVQAREGYSY